MNGTGRSHGDGSDTVLNRDVVGSDDGTQAGAGKVVLKVECTERGVGLGEVGRGGEGGWLLDEQEDVSCRGISVSRWENKMDETYCELRNLQQVQVRRSW